MQTQITFLVATFVAGGVLAQTTVTSPRGYAAVAGGDEAQHFGAGSFSRYMILDGEWRHTPMTLRGVEYRPLPRLPSQGRTFQNVTVHASECDFDKTDWFSGRVAFSGVPTTTPTEVFRASVTFPATLSTAPFDWRVSLPFKTTWVYSGATDICLDHRFSVGILTGATGPWFKHYIVPYYLDATPMEFALIDQGSTQYGPRSCKDSASNQRATTALSIGSYGPLYPTHPPNRGQTIASICTSIGANTSVLHMLSLFGSRTGVTTPLVNCQDLFLDLRKPTIFHALQTIGGGVSYVTYRIPYEPRWAGVGAWSQTAFLDSVTGALKLTAPASSTVPRLPTFYRRGAVQSMDGALPNGVGTLQAEFVPIARYLR